MADLYIGIDIGGTSVKAGLVDQDGSLIERETAPNINSSDEHLSEAVSSLAQNLQKKSGLKTPLPVGIGSPAPFDQNAGVVYTSANMPNLKTARLFQSLEKAGFHELSLNNDANCAALGSHRFGAGRSYKDLAVLTLGTGVGGGLILNNRLFSGWQTNGFEIGHVYIQPGGFEHVHGRLCGCGNLGCLETISSATGITKTFSELSGKDCSAEQVADLARHGDLSAKNAYQAAGAALGESAALLSNLLNLEAILFTGGVAKAADLLKMKIKEHFNKHSLPNLRDRCQLIFDSEDADMGIKGAAAQFI